MILINKLFTITFFIPVLKYGAEQNLGLVEVTSVEGKFSHAKILSGAQEIQYGDVCKLQKKAIEESKAAYPRVTPGW
jgi:hypothetical protein